MGVNLKIPECHAGLDPASRVGLIKQVQCFSPGPRFSPEANLKHARGDSILKMKWINPVETFRFLVV